MTMPSHDETTTGEDEEPEEDGAQDETASSGRFEGTIYERMLQFFYSTGNAPASNREIRVAIGASRGTVAMVLYNTHPEDFTKVETPGSHIIRWKLVDRALKAAEYLYGPEGDGQETLFKE